MTLDTALRRKVYEVLWSPSVKSILGRVPVLRRLYDGWSRRHPIDAVYGIETSGVVSPDECAPGADLVAHMSPYAGSQPSIVRASLALLPDHVDYAFVDLGCGKGRPLVVASELPFARLLGVEISPALAAIARTNADAIAAAHPDRTRIEVQVGDASAAPMLSRRVVYYVYHPFDRSLVQMLVADIERQLDADVDHAFFVYYNPVHGDVLDGSARFTRWSADVLPYAADELGYGPDVADSVVIWQTRPAQYAPRPGAARPIIVELAGSRARVEA